MSVEKEPLTMKEYEKILKGAKDIDDFTYRTIALLGETGMHISVLCNETYKLRIDGKHLVWNRPKKKGKQAYTKIIISERLKPFIEEYLKTPRPTWRQYYNQIIKTVGIITGFPKLSPMTFRHTLAIRLLEDGFTPNEVRQILNCSLKTLDHYGKYRQDMIDKKFEDKGW
jgi:integrase|tara:strand:- start:24468 stop:24977 length:510 start_codon:yes stop_codon:yes gene_type:complete